MRTIKRAILPALILTVCVAAQAIVQPSVEIIPDVVYGHKDGLAMTFDVLKPKANANGAAVIFMVSGGWVSNYSPPQQAALRFKDLLDKGFTVISVRHGSSPKYLIPEIVSDVRRAVRFIHHNAKQWGVDPNRMGVFGGRAGGPLTAAIPTGKKIS
jgi:acetyl esterase/lipase